MNAKSLTPEQVRAAMQLESKATAPMDPEGAAREAEQEGPPVDDAGEPQPEPAAEGIFRSVDDVCTAYVVIAEGVTRHLGEQAKLPREELDGLCRVTAGELAAVRLLGTSAMPVLNMARLPPVVAAAGLALLLGASVAMRAKSIDRRRTREEKRDAGQAQ